MKNKVGQENIANNGQKMVIINYRSCRDLDVRFEDGTVVQNRSYASFANGTIRNPNKINVRSNFPERIGETVIANNGQKMTLIAYHGANDVDVEFEDGTIVYGKVYHNFKVGEIWNPNCPTVRVPKKIRVGEISTATNGQKIKIVAYHNYADVDIQFEDGTIVYHKSFSNFLDGKVKNPNTEALRRQSHIGETVVASNGQKMTIVNYHSTKSIDVQFEDGTIVYNKRYNNFKRGLIANPNS